MNLRLSGEFLMAKERMMLFKNIVLPEPVNPINNKCSLAIFKKKFTFFFAERYFFFDTNGRLPDENQWI